MNKFKLATKKIVAVGTAVAVASSSALAAFPGMFVEDDKFMADVVVGADAAASDMTAAEALIASLETKYSGNSNMVEITATMRSEGGESVDVVRSNSQLNYGESLGTTGVTEELDDSDVDFLEDGKFNNGVSDEDYTQEIMFADGEFNYALRDNVDGVDEISNNLYFNSGETYVSYVLEFDSVISLSSISTQSELEEEFIGETLTIMGNEFTIASISADLGGTNNIEELELIGGANKIALGEGESTSVTVDGTSYDVSIQSVSDDEVLLTVNGQSVSIDEYDTEEVAGISIAATDLVSSSRDAVKGYAEVVIGGQKITLEDSGEVQVNEEDVSDEFDGYLVESTIETSGGFDKITITYKVDEDVSLEAGDSLIDPLFGGFELVFEGTNNPEYSEVEFRVNDDDISIDGTLESGEELSRDLVHTTSTDGTTGATYLKGDQDEDVIFTSASDFSAGNLLAVLSGTGMTATPAEISFDTANTAIKGSGFLMYDDEESQYLYEISSVDTTDNEVDFDELFEGKDKEELTTTEVLSDLELTLTDVSTTGSVISFLPSSLQTPVIAFENELLVNVGSVESTGVGGTFVLSLDTGDVDGDDATNDEDEEITITMSWDSTDEEFDLDVAETGDGSFINENDADIEDGNSDVQHFVTPYGTMVEFDNDENTYVKVMVPEEQVEAKVMLVTGGSSAETRTWTVSEDEVESTKSDLIADGWTIVSENEMSTEDVEFMVEGVTLDVDASSENVIVIGGPAVNEVARELLGIGSYDVSQAGVEAGEGVARVFEEENSVLIYGYSAEDTTAIVNEVIAGTANFQ